MIAKDKNDIETLRIAGRALGEVLKELSRVITPGMTTAELDVIAEREIEKRGGKSTFLGYRPDGAPLPYPSVLCISINDEVVHGIPNQNVVIKEGDLVSIDLGLSINGYFVDSAVTVCVGKCDENGLRLAMATREALGAAIAQATVGNHIGDIGAAVERIANKYSLAVVEDLGGHAVGRAVHEKPFIPNYGPEGEGEEIVEGMVLAIEPMLTEGKGTIVLDADEWTYRTKDGSRAAHFEHTILVTKNGPEILTQ